MLKALAAAVALALTAGAFAQTTTTTTSTTAQLTAGALQVQLLGPQLVAFAGSTGNFESLVNGLTTGAPVTLTTTGVDGQMQIVTFLPAGTLTAAEAARQLESARQNLIVRGIATPTAHQLAVSLVGGTLPTLAGNTTIPGVITGTAGGRIPIQVRNEIATLTTVPGATALNLSALQLQALRNGLAQGTPINLGGTATSVAPAVGTAASGTAGAISFTVPGGPMNAFQVEQSLQLASVLLAQQGILNPSPDQVRVALLGGTLTGVNGNSIQIGGVLTGRVSTTSASSVNTSVSPFFGTSNTPPTSGPLPAPPAALLAPGVVPPPTIPTAAPAAALRPRPATRPGG